METKSTETTQKIIQRLTVQAFAIKGFSFTFVGLVGNILKDISSPLLLSASVLAIAVFWFLDTFYLSAEKAYRQLEEIGDFSKGFDYKKYGIKLPFYKTLFNITVMPIYIVQFLFIIFLYITVVY